MFEVVISTNAQRMVHRSQRSQVKPLESGTMQIASIHLAQYFVVAGKYLWSASINFETLYNVVVKCDDLAHHFVLAKGLTSNAVLSSLKEPLIKLRFQVEIGKRVDEKIKRPVFLWENSKATLQYEIDAYHPDWKCGLEIEAGRACKETLFIAIYSSDGHGKP